MRVLFTASREHTDEELICLTLFALYSEWRHHAAEGEKFIVVHGDARGGDQIAKRWALDTHKQDSRVDQEGHPADWERYHRAAGHIRNKEMVALGADRCVGFPIGRSPGTRDCMALARKAKIPTKRYDPRTLTGLK